MLFSCFVFVAFGVEGGGSLSDVVLAKVVVVVVIVIVVVFSGVISAIDVFSLKKLSMLRKIYFSSFRQRLSPTRRD